MKIFALTSALTTFVSSAFAGSVAFVAPVVPEMVVEETGSMGGSGMWLLPLLAIALIFLVMKDSDDGERERIKCVGISCDGQFPE